MEVCGVKTLFLIDGEHYPSVIGGALRELVERDGLEPVALFWLGGTEKVGGVGELEGLGLPVLVAQDMLPDLAAALERLAPELVIDLSDEPVLDTPTRFAIGSLILKSGAVYRGADFEFHPPRLEAVIGKPSCSIIGTGKRSGKTAVSAQLARTLVERGHRPVVVAMGRGGPPSPEVLKGEEQQITPEFLLAQCAAGKHAASDYFEDALTARVTTIGCRRCGGGMAGEAFVTNFAEGAAIAAGLPEDVVILEGSGTAIPPVQAATRILVASAAQPFEVVGGYFGTYRLLLSDYVVITMCEKPFADPPQIWRLEEEVRRVREDARILRTVFRPLPLTPIQGRSVYFTSTAPPEIGWVLRAYLEEKYDCQVVGISHNLSNRSRLLADLEAAPPFELLLTELKAAAVDVATRYCVDRSLGVVYADNLPISVGEESEREFFGAVAERMLENVGKISA